MEIYTKSVFPQKPTNQKNPSQTKPPHTTDCLPHPFSEMHTQMFSEWFLHHHAYMHIFWLLQTPKLFFSKISVKFCLWALKLMIIKSEEYLCIHHCSGDAKKWAAYRKKKNHSSQVHSYFTLPEPEDLPGNLSDVLKLVFQNVSLVPIPH